jgi:hypothetical protein
MEYEIYYLCNILGVILILVIILFHFVEADEGTKNREIDSNSSEADSIKK